MSTDQLLPLVRQPITHGIFPSAPSGRRAAPTAGFGRSWQPLVHRCPKEQRGSTSMIDYSHPGPTMNTRIEERRETDDELDELHQMILDAVAEQPISFSDLVNELIVVRHAREVPLLAALWELVDQRRLALSPNFELSRL